MASNQPSFNNPRRESFSETHHPAVPHKIGPESAPLTSVVHQLNTSMNAAGPYQNMSSSMTPTNQPGFRAGMQSLRAPSIQFATQPVMQSTMQSAPHSNLQPLYDNPSQSVIHGAGVLTGGYNAPVENYSVESAVNQQMDYSGGLTSVAAASLQMAQGGGATSYYPSQTAVQIGENRWLEKGAERVISETTHVGNGEARIVSEQYIEHEMTCPKKIIREDIIEKMIIIPETRLTEEYTEESRTIREKIIEIAVPVIQEKVVEIPEIEYVERVVEVPEIITQERVVEVPVIEQVENVIEVPKIVYKERVVEVSEVEYRDVPVETIVEVPEIRERITYKKVPVPQYVDVPVPEYKDIVTHKQINRFTPIPVEAVTTCEFKLPKFKPHYTSVEIPLYVPRFVEVPVATDTLDPATLALAERLAAQVASLSGQTNVSLCAIENLAVDIRNADFDQRLGSSQTVSNVITESWRSGRVEVDTSSLTMTRTETSTPIVL